MRNSSGNPPPSIAGEITIGILFAAAIAAVEAGFGSVVRPLFPVASMACAAWLLRTGRRVGYIALCLWLFMLTPGLRRFVDLSDGWSRANELMLAPYAAAILSAGPVARAIVARHFTYSGLFAVVFACIFYGLVLGIADGYLSATSFEFLRWVVPPSFALFIALDQGRQSAYRVKATNTLTAGLILLSLYGFYQLIFVPPWDELWMRMSEMQTNGRPEPFLVHVFSTMNSPGSLANYLMAGLLLALSSRSYLKWPSIVFGAITLLLTLIRTGWLCLIFGLAYLLVNGTSRINRLSILGGLFCVPLVLLILQQVPEAHLVIVERFNTLSEVQDDASLEQRLHNYQQYFTEWFPAHPFGGGLGSSTVYQSYVDNNNSMRMDGAILEIVTDLGVFGGGLYLLTLMVIVLMICWEGVGRKDEFYSSCAAIILADAIWSVSGTVSVGEVGFVFWMAVGFCLGAQSLPTSAEEPRLLWSASYPES